MPGGQTHRDARPAANETALAKSLDRTIAREHPTAWHIATTRLTPTRAGIPDRLIILDGHLYAFELKRPKNPQPLTARQRRELYELGRAGATVAVINSVERGLAILAGEDAGDPYETFKQQPKGDR